MPYLPCKNFCHGACEYNSIPEFDAPKDQYDSVKISTIKDPKDWKVGAIEPTTGIHGDIEYLYVLDTRAKEIHSIEIISDYLKWRDAVKVETWKHDTEVK